MTAIGNARTCLRALAALVALLAWGCLQDKLAGGSSEVDNPIVVAFVDSTGASATTTGSLSIYLASQNPALDPNPVFTVQVDNASSLKLSSETFAQGLGDTTLSYNLLLIGDNDSVGAFLQNLSWQPGKRRFTLDSAVVTTVKIPLVPLVRYEASLNSSSDTGLVRVFIPGTPFQSVVVESTFVIEGLPAGAFSLHVIDGGGRERPVKPAPPPNAQNPGYHHKIDTTAPPITRPPPPPPTDTLVVFAGPDASLPASPNGITGYSLFGMVQGVDRNDKRLAVQWRQIMPGPQGAKAVIENPTNLNTRVALPRPGAYQFILSGVLVNQRVEDTVLIGIQAPLENAVFIEPTLDDTMSMGRPFDIFWEGRRDEVLSLQVSRDGGATWQSVASGIPSHPGPNKRTWTPPTSAGTSGNCLLRLRDSTNVNIAVSQRFVIAERSDNSLTGSPQSVTTSVPEPERSLEPKEQDREKSLN